METEHKKKIEELIRKLHCYKNFECKDAGFKVLCKAKDSGHEEYLECLDVKVKDLPDSQPSRVSDY